MKSALTLFKSFASSAFATKPFLKIIPIWIPMLLVLLLGEQGAWGQTNNYFGTSGTISGNVWSTNPAGPYTSAFNVTGGGIMNFGNTVTSITGASITVAGINATADVSGWNAAGTISNQSNGVITIDVASGKTLDFGTQSFTSSGSAGYIKNGSGVLALAGNTYGGGFTLNAGTIIVRGVNAMGGAASNTLTLNGGIVAANATRNLTDKYGSGITIGGNIQFGDNVGLASNTANLTFTNNISLGSATRTLTLGNSGNHTFSGTISGSGGIIFSANSNGSNGTFTLATNNTYTGKTTLNGGIVSVSGESAFGANPGSFVADQITFDGGTLSASGNINFSSNRGITINSGGAFLNTNANTITLTNVTTGTGGITKSGSGTLVFAGNHTYSGSTTINTGTLQINVTNAIPTTSDVILSNTAGVQLDLNSYNQTIASLASTGTGTGVITNSNIINQTSTLTINGSNSTTFGLIIQDGNGQRKIALVRSGTGTTTLTGANTYTGGTTISGGTIQLGASGVLADGGAITLDGGTFRTGATTGFSETVGTLNLNANSTIALGTGSHTLTFAASNGVTWAGTTLTITGWTGTPGATGTAGKIFVGNSTSGLTAAQLNKIKFQGYVGATILSSGEVVPTSSCPSISATLSGTATICSGSSTNLNVAITGGTSPYTVVYSDGTTNFTVNSYTSGSNISVSPSSTKTYNLVSVADANGCTAVTLSGTPTVTVNATPTITLGANPIICQTTTIANLPYTATTGSPDGYSIDFDAAANTAGISDINNFSLPASPIEINILFAIAPGTYTGVLTVRNNTTGCVSNNYSISITVNAPISVQFSQACQGASATLIRVLATNAPSGQYLVKNGSTTVAGPTTNGQIASFSGSIGTTYSVVDNGGASCTTTFLTGNSINCGNETICADNSYFDLNALGYTKPSYIGQNGNFNAVIGGSYTTNNADVEGKLAIGLDFINNTSFSVGQASGSGAGNAPSGSDNLIVGGSITGTVQVRGNAVYGSGTASGVGFTGGSTGLKRSFPGSVSTNILDIAGAILAFQNKSTALAACTEGNTGTVSGLGTNTVTLDGGNQSGLIKFTLPSAPSNTAYNFINVGNASNILINVTSTSANFVESSILLNSISIGTPLSGGNLSFAEKTLWNFPTTTTFTLTNYALIGSVLAPSASGTVSGGSINGQAVFGGSLTQSNGFEFHNFCYVGTTSSCNLPITLLEFTGVPASNSVKLYWRTATEQNNAYMEVQRSKDGIHFYTIGRVKGHGTTLLPQSYQYTDQQPFAGINYYRLRQVDADGNFEYHTMIAVEMKPNAVGNVHAYPSPTSNHLMIEWTSPSTERESAILKLFDWNGRVVHKEVIEVSDDMRKALDVSHLVNGHYIISVQTSTYESKTRFIKVDNK